MSNIFDGVWEMSRETSTRWDRATKQWIPESIDKQVITMRHEGDVQHYQCDVYHPGVTSYMGYTCRFGNSEWTPYMVHRVEGDSESPKLEPHDNRTSPLVVGRPFLYVVQVKVDERTHYRISKNLDGSAAYVLERRMAEDGQSYVAYMMNVGGLATVAKRFERVQ